MSGSAIPVILVFGPTASGKTSLALELFGGTGSAEIVSADSMQVYRGMDIGTAKPDASCLSALPHHLIDIRNPDEQFCAGDFVRLADEACADIHSRGKVPVVLGGTAFYIKHFLYGLPVTPESDPETRNALISRMKAEGADVLHRELASVDPESAARIHVRDEYRILRALEVFAASGKPLSSFGLARSFRDGYRFLAFALERGREELNARIDARVDGMFDAGLAREVALLREAGFVASDPGMQAIGYREFFDPEAASLGEGAIRERIKIDSRKYAKRQETFIRPMRGIVHVPAGDSSRVCREIGAFNGAFLGGT
jgi:tRNA dimethylallyltransferase